MKHLLPILLISLFLSIVHGSIYYVATDGNDSSSGTLVSPWATIQKAANELVSGDTVFIRGGIYYEKVTLNVSGSENEGYINFLNYENETPILDGTEIVVPEDYNGMFLIVDQNYIKIEGFEIRNYRTSIPDNIPVGINIRGASHHIQLRNNHIHNIETNASVDNNLMGADAHGIAVYGTSSNPINNIIIDGNELHNLKLGSSEGLVLNGNVTVFTVSNNIIHDCDNIAIDFIGFEDTSPDGNYDQARNGEVSDNIIFNISSFGNPSYGDSYSAGGIYVDGGRDIIIERNIVYNSDIGIEIASEHFGNATSFITIRNNLLYNNRMTGIAMGGYDSYRGSTENCLIINNTLYHNDTLEDGNGEILLQFDTKYNVIKNNIFYANNQNLMIGNPFSQNLDNIVDYNLYFSSEDMMFSEWEWKGELYQGFSNYKLAAGNDNHSLFDNPQFSDLLNQNFSIQFNSPCIDAGDPNLPLGLDGTIYDIGAYQYSQLSNSNHAIIKHNLNNSFPNPFNPITTISYDLSTLSNIHINIYNINGQIMEVLSNKVHQPGTYNVIWNAEGYTSGVYFVKLIAGEFVYTQKIMLIK